MCPQRALEIVAQGNMYPKTPANGNVPAALTQAGIEAFNADLAEHRTPEGYLDITAKQRQLVALVRNHYEPLADNRLGQKRWGVGLALGAAALGLTFMLGSVKSTDWHVKERQHNMEQRVMRSQYFTGKTPFDYNDNKTLEDNLKNVETEAKNDRKGGKGLIYVLTGLGFLASLAGYVFHRRNRPVQPAPAPAAPAPAAPPNPAPAAPAAPLPIRAELLRRAAAGEQEALDILSAYIVHQNRQRRNP